MLDRLAVFLSGLCMLHCLLAPALVSLVPMFGWAKPGGESFHLLLFGLVLPTSLVALAAGYRRHREVLVPMLGLAGLSLIVIALWALPVSSLEERLLTSFGGLVLAWSHILNFRRCRLTRGTGVDVA